MEPANATGGSAWRWLCLERQHLSKLVEGCLRDHGDALEWTEILRPARQTSEGVVTMKTGSTKVVRCAIYTRVSTDQCRAFFSEVLASLMVSPSRVITAFVHARASAACPRLRMTKSSAYAMMRARNACPHPVSRQYFRNRFM